jgi:signal peptidase I
MFNKWRKYSYAAQKSQLVLIRRVILWVAVFFALHTLLTVFVFSMRALENETMQPGLRRGDRFIFSSYVINRLLPDKALSSRPLPFRRGHIVLVDTSLRENPHLFTIALDTLVRFFTAQRIGAGDWGEHFFIKRVIAQPGDEISMTKYVLWVKPRGEIYRFTEYEVSEKPYSNSIPQVSAPWDESLPFSGTLAPVVLGDDECFVLSDDRSNTNDSRTWGPIPTDFIAGRALFRYWPLNRLGRP